MKNDFTLTATVPAKPADIYAAWLSTKGHSEMTGAAAKVDGRVGGDFTAWDGYIWGTFTKLVKNKKIVQTWRTSEFAEEAEDSNVEVTLEESAGKTKITLKHTNVPPGENGYKQGWKDFYFTPMQEFFSRKRK